jgi:tRNA-specific 2-thiouridylase
MGDRVIVGMSGGVDSSIAAALLVEQGCDVVGVTLRVWPWKESSDPTGKFGSCCSPETVDDARQVARSLGIPYYLLNSEREFDSTVIANFTREYLTGRTPVPCVVCNQKIKFGSLLHRALAWEATGVATGHYARLETDPHTGRILLRKAKDSKKDQTDFLWPLTQEQLRHARFPIGGFTKDEVRAKARSLGLGVADKPESQEICFIPENDYRGFLRRRDPRGFRPGYIVDRNGRILGAHQGLSAYTIGQRKGLGLSTGEPLYVVALEPESNTVVVGQKEELKAIALTATTVNFIPFDQLDGDLRIDAKIRHNHIPARATLRPSGEREVTVVFDEPQRAITPGQSVVFYQGDLVVGGGIIAS